MNKYDLIVVGQGPCGISCAIYVKRAGLSVAVIGAGVGALEKAERVENFYGAADNPSGAELAARGVAQAKELGVDVISAQVTSVSMDTPFVVKTDKGEFTADAVLLATGKARKTSKIEGVERLRGSGVSFCAVCDGFFYRKKSIGLIGAGAYARAELEELMHFTNDITVFTNGEQIECEFPEDVKIVETPIAQICGEERVTAVETTDGTKFEVAGVFVAEGMASSSDLAEKAGIMTEASNIIVDEKFQTNVEGIYAAGDCIGGLLQISKAVSDGAQAAMSIIPRLRARR